VATVAMVGDAAPSRSADRVARNWPRIRLDS
jgi:hypothetical protein